MLFHSEAWHAITENEIKILEVVDESLFWAGAVPIRYIIISRRFCFHQTILKRDINELTRNIYEEQKVNPTPGDFSELVNNDFKIINEVQNDEKIRQINTTTYKKHIKHSVKFGLASKFAPFLSNLAPFSGEFLWPILRLTFWD